MNKEKIDIIGKRFSKLVVLERAEDHVSPSGYHFAQYLCQCDCGNKKVIRKASLTTGATKTCGHCKKDTNILGKRFGRLTVTKVFVEKSPINGKNIEYCECKCDCGNTFKTMKNYLIYENNRSCGCLKRKKGFIKPKIDFLTGELFGNKVNVLIGPNHPEIENLVNVFVYTCSTIDIFNNPASLSAYEKTISVRYFVIIVSETAIDFGEENNNEIKQLKLGDLIIDN